MIGRALEDIPTPALLLDLDALDGNVALLARLTAQAGLGHRPHAKGHKSVEIAKRQIKAGAVGICCQKLSEAEVFIAAGIGDVLITNEIVDPEKIARVCELRRQGRVILIVDDPAAVSLIDAAAGRAGVKIELLIEIDLGQNRCGVSSIAEAVHLAEAIGRCDHLIMHGVQAYQGKLQHVGGWEARRKAVEATTAVLSEYLACLRAQGHSTEIVTGGGTGTLETDCALRVYTDLQPGSYAVMDAQYKAIGGREAPDFSLFQHALTVATQVMSVRRDWCVIDAGLKAMSSDAGQPEIVGRGGLSVSFGGDEHAIVRRTAEESPLVLGQKLRIIPGHCDTTINLYDAYFVHQGGRVIDIWPVDARGRTA